MSETPYQALLVVSFGGPEGMDDVMPFLENVLRGKNVPHDRMLEVADHYQHFGGVSPINQQNRELIDALSQELQEHQIALPIYWGNRNWNPTLPQALEQMANDGITKALAFFTSIYSCYSGCRQYRENIAEAQLQVGDKAPEINKLRMSFNHPKYISASVDRVREAYQALQHPPQQTNGVDPSNTRFVFTAHSIPMSMAENCKYQTQLTESCRLIMQEFAGYAWDLVYQSRSGPPHQPWLEPDICDFLGELHAAGETKNVVLMPVGFVSDHMEVLFDLDTEAKDLCDSVGLRMERAKTVGTHPHFISMIRELIQERAFGMEKLAIGSMPANWDVCPVDCCLYPRPTRPVATGR